MKDIVQVEFNNCPDQLLNFVVKHLTIFRKTVRKCKDQIIKRLLC